MTTCAECGDAEATHDTDPFSDYGRMLCRPCWKRVRGIPPAGGRGPDWAERNPEAADHEAARNRQRVLENAVAKGGRL
jgi:hypothetical protein